MILSTRNVVKSLFTSGIKNLTVAAVIITPVVTPYAVLSQGADNGDPVAIYREAGINAEQEASIRKIADEYDKDSTQRLESLGQLLHQLKDMAYKPKLDGTAMLAKQDEINKLQSEMAMQRIKLVIKIRGLLTPVQNEKLATALQNRAHSEEQQARLR